MAIPTRTTRGRTYTRRDTGERFWSFVEKQTGDGCWTWRGQKTKRGYGKFYVSTQRKTTAYTASRFVIFLETGSHVPAELFVCHHCDNPSCVRPSHLFVGTQRENILDAKAKGRIWIPSDRYRTRTHCKHGHEFTPENTRVAPKGTLICRACCRARTRAYRSRRVISSPAV